MTQRATCSEPSATFLLVLASELMDSTGQTFQNPLRFEGWVREQDGLPRDDCSWWRCVLRSWTTADPRSAPEFK